MFMTYDKIVRVLLCGCVSVVPAALLQLLGLCSCFLAFLTAWAASAAIYLAVASLKVEVTGKAVLVTGCDTGFGHALALHLHKLGFRVFAGCLQDSSQGAHTLRKVGSSRLHVLHLDITNQDHLARSLKEVKRALLPTEVLWGLVNNAAIETYGAIEWVTLDTYRKICSVNILGTIAVTKTFLPLIRQAKGRVVTVGSVRGRVPTPLGSPYDITKYAIEAFNDDLRNEMRRFGVGVCLIEPGNFTAGTNILRKEAVLHYERQMWDAMEEEVREAYGKNYYDQTTELRLEAITSGNPDISEVIYAMTEALTQRLPQGRYQPMDLYLYLVLFLAQHFPEWLYDHIFIEYLFKKGW